MPELLLKNLTELDYQIREFEDEIIKSAILPKDILEFEGLYEHYQKFLNAYVAVCSSAQSDKERLYLSNYEGIKVVQNINYYMQILYERYVHFFKKDNVKYDALDEAMFQKSWEDFIQILSFKKLERELIKGNNGIANYADLIRQYEFLETKVMNQKNLASVNKHETAMGRMELRKEEAEVKLGKYENKMDFLLNLLNKKNKYEKKDKLVSIESHKNDIILDFDFFDRLTLVSQMKYLDCLLRNIEALEMNSDWESVVEVQYQGKIKQISSYYEPLYRKYMAMQKNLSIKFMKNVDETTKESQEQHQLKEQFSDFKNINGAIARADEKLETSDFQSEDSMEDIYEKICQLQNQEEKDDKAEQMLKVYKNKLRRMYNNKKSKNRQEVDAFWRHFPAITGIVKVSEKMLHFWHLCTYEPEEFMQSKEFSDDTKAHIISKILSFFDLYKIQGDSFINEQRENLEKNQTLLSASDDKKVLKMKKKKKSKDKKKLRLKINRNSKKVVISSKDIENLSIIVEDGQVEIRGRG